ncbi:MAG: hypothetical protein EZS28_027637 [Streblomastix strix]|uniref:Uncharacterized protein n=1 Tax=Streblomastix strix TaxID=222440 RepID=A0A5J4V468_9EUKA|nr:MAG: hypothetical protein EZS28_027637 [Streblomastix strix]
MQISHKINRVSISSAESVGKFGNGAIGAFGSEEVDVKVLNDLNQFNEVVDDDDLESKIKDEQEEEEEEDDDDDDDDIDYGVDNNQYDYEGVESICCELDSCFKGVIIYYSDGF